MRSKAALLFFVSILLLFQSCRMVDVLAGGERAGTVDNLWPDVPAIAGAKKTDLAIPLATRLIIRTIMQGKINFIAYTTDRSASEVQQYYSKERMKAAGWDAAEAGCVGDMESGPEQGGVCIFIRPKDLRENALAIVIAEDPEMGETHIFYARIDGVPAEEVRREQERARAKN